jgi:P27 family predicted phage terminase small subunit
MTRGRKPLPTHLKILEGNPGKRALNKNEPKPAATKPRCPQWLPATARKAWRETVKELETMGLLARADTQALIVFCQAVAEHQAAGEEVNQLGVTVDRDGIRVKNPACQVQKDNASIIIRVAAEFGLTPSARSRISMPPERDERLAEKYLS